MERLFGLTDEPVETAISVTRFERYSRESLDLFTVVNPVYTLGSAEGYDRIELNHPTALDADSDPCKWFSLRGIEDVALLPSFTGLFSFSAWLSEPPKVSPESSLKPGAHWENEYIPKTDLKVEGYSYPCKVRIDVRVNDATDRIGKWLRK